MSTNFEDIRKLFPATEKITYFTPNWKTPLPKATADAVHKMIDGFMNSPLDTIIEGMSLMQPTREKVAKLIGCDADEVAFGRSTAEGILWLAQSMPWEEGDEVLIPRNQYPTLVYPFMAQQHYGVKVVLVDQDNWRITPEVIEKGITDRTRVVAVSWPQFDNGQRSDLKTISQICHEHGVILFVDPIQGLGSFRFNVREMGIDCLSANTYKWMFGLPGLSVFYCRKSLLAQLRPVHVGLLSLEGEIDMEFSTDSYNFEPARSARRYEEGIHNYVGVVALNASLDLIEKIGVENIEHRIKELTDYLCENAKAKGCEIVSPREGNEWSGIVLIRLPKQDPYKLYQELAKKKIYTYAMRDCLIVGVSIYNNHKDIDCLLSYIEAR